jgi:hypothetical protein
MWLFFLWAGLLVALGSAQLPSQLFKKQHCMTNIVWHRSFDPPMQNTIVAPLHACIATADSLGSCVVVLELKEYVHGLFMHNSKKQLLEFLLAQGLLYLDS